MRNWNKTRLNQVLDYEQPTKYIVETTDYDDSFNTPVLTAGKSFLLGHTNETTGIFKNVPAIIFDDFTTAFHYVDFPFKVKSSAMKILTTNKDKANLRFLYYRMRKVRIDTELHKRYWISKFSKVEIPLPPLKTQKHIAQILDDAAALRDKTKELLTEYDLLAQSIFLEMFGDPVVNPKKWKIKNLNNISNKITDGTHHSPKLVKQGYPYVTAKHIKPMSLEFEAKRTFVDEVAHSEIYSRCKPEYNDVFLIKDGATTGVACLNSFKTPISLLSSVGLIKPNIDFINPTYLVFWFNHNGVKQDLIRRFMSGAAIKRYTISKIKKFQVLTPPIEIQNQFAEKIALIEKQKDLAKQELKESEDLFNCLLQKAFKGELS